MSRFLDDVGAIVACAGMQRYEQMAISRWRSPVGHKLAYIVNAIYVTVSQPRFEDLWCDNSPSYLFGPKLIYESLPVPSSIIPQYYADPSARANKKFRSLRSITYA